MAFTIKRVLDGPCGRCDKPISVERRGVEFVVTRRPNFLDAVRFHDECVDRAMQGVRDEDWSKSILRAAETAT